MGMVSTGLASEAGVALRTPPRLSTNTFYTNSTTSFQLPQGSEKKFCMVSNTGDVLEHYYLEVKQMPSSSNPIGEIYYIDGESSKEAIELRHDPETDTFVAWHRSSPQRTFSMQPIMHNDCVVGLMVHWDEFHSYSFVLLDNGDAYSEEDQVVVMELEQVSF